MSRAFGRIQEVYDITRLLQDTELPKYKTDRKRCTWEDIAETPERVEIYLPDQAIEFLASKPIKIMNSPFLRYTLTQIPDTEEEDRFIKFTSKIPRDEFKRELMFYVGMLLSSYNPDDLTDIFNTPGEYDDTLPLYLEYLYLKFAGKEKEFSLKQINLLKRYVKYFPKAFKDYQDFADLKEDARYADLTSEEYERFQNLSLEKDADIECFAKDCLAQLSSMESALALIEQAKTEDEIKQVILALMLNKNRCREDVLTNMGIESSGFKRLRKEINTLKK